MLPLQGLRIVEVGLGPVTGLATMILADFGAEVVRIEPPGGDPLAALMPSSRLWRRGKDVVELNLGKSAHTQALRELVVATADAFITTLQPARRLSARLDFASLSGDRPDLVHGAVSGFAESGAYAAYAGYEGLVAAKFGRMMSFEGASGRTGPNYSALQVGVHATAQSAATALLAGLHKRAASGVGSSFSTSLMRGMLPYDLAGLQTEQLAARGIIERPHGRQDVLSVMPRIYYHAARTRDGQWIQLGNLLPHLQDNFYRAAGIELPPGGVPEEGEELEAFRDQLLAHFAQRDLREWMELFVSDGGIVAHPYQTTQDALQDPDLTANGHVTGNPTGSQLGVLARLEETPGRPGAPARFRQLDTLPQHEPQRRSVSGAGSPLPLAGITVVEAATIIAAPLGAATLADLGARVIKLEPIGGDPFRQMMGGIGAAKCNTGKESLCVDLKSQAGQTIARKLIEGADLFIHNYRPGVPERLGLGYDEVRASNSGLVYLSANGYGPLGPGAHRPSTHPIPGAALGGVVWQMGGLPGPGPMSLAEVRETTRRLFRANEVNPDPNTSMVIATAATLGLLARDQTGRGQQIFVDMFGANAYANWDDFLSYPDKPARPAVDSEQHGLSARYRLYPCAHGWIFLCVRNDTEWAALEVTGEAELEAKFATRDADHWERTLSALGINCVRADGGWPADFLLHDPHAREEELVVPASHAQWGNYLRHGPMVRFQPDAGYPGASVAGDSTRALLEEVGYASEQVEQLLKQGIVQAFDG